jgi:divalent metal cation (Fe/Co/Zn/Cd) transporter
MPMSTWTVTSRERAALVGHGTRLEVATLSWNVVGVGVLASSVLSAHSVALGGFGLDSLIEIGASTVVLWELRGEDARRGRRALRGIGLAFACLAVYLIAQGVIALVSHYQAGESTLGIGWTGVTAVVMWVLARAKGRVGRELDNAVLTSEAHVTMVDSILAASIFVGVSAHALFGWWWADPLGGFLLAAYAVKECRAIFSPKS